MSTVGRNPEGKKLGLFAHSRRGFDTAPSPEIAIKNGNVETPIEARW